MPDPSIASQASMEEAARKAISRLTKADEIKIKSALDNRLLNDSAIDWIYKSSEKDLISINQIISQTPSTYAEKVLGRVPSRRLARLDWQSAQLLAEDIILTIDTWDTDLNDKNEYLRQIKTQLSVMRTPPKKTKWIDKNNKDQADWCYNYLRKKSIFAPELPEPRNQSELLTGILYSIDSYRSTYIKTKDKFLDSFYKAWKQHKYRADGNERFDYHLPLKKETKRKLAKISALSNISEAKMLDTIIQEAYVRLEADKY